MTKEDLVDLLSRETNFPKRVLEVAVKTMFKSMVKALGAGESIELRGFGSFRVKTREARIGCNPKTGEEVPVPKRKVPSFRPGKELLETISHPPSAH